MEIIREMDAQGEGMRMTQSTKGTKSDAYQTLDEASALEEIINRINENGRNFREMMRKFRNQFLAGKKGEEYRKAVKEWESRKQFEARKICFEEIGYILMSSQKFMFLSNRRGGIGINMFQKSINGISEFDDENGSGIYEVNTIQGNQYVWIEVM